MLYRHWIPCREVRLGPGDNDQAVRFLLSLNRQSFSLSRGTDKLKELSGQPVLVERVEQLLSDNDPQVRQVRGNGNYHIT